MACGILGQCRGFESFVSTPASSNKASQFGRAGASVQASSLVHSHSVKILWQRITQSTLVTVVANLVRYPIRAVLS